MKTVHEGVQTMIRALEDLQLDAQKFDEGNTKAGTRVAKMLREIKDECWVLAKAIYTIRKSRAQR